MKKLFFNRYFVVLLVLMICFLPTAITQEAESESDAIVTAIGVDYFPAEENIELSLQIVVPTPSAQYSQQLSVVSTKEKTVARAASDIELRLGKYVSFPHCKVITFNEDALKDGIEKHLDFVIRNKANSNNIVILGTKDSAKEMLNSISDIDNSLYFSTNNSGGFNKEYLRGTQISLGDFYKNYQTEDSSCLVGNVSLEKAEDVGMVSIPSMSGGGDSSSSENNSKSQKTVVNKGESSLIKNGKMIMPLTPEQTMGFNWFDTTSTKGFLLIKNVNDDLYKNADVGVELERKETSIKAYFDDKTPVFCVTTRLYVRVAEIVEDIKDDRIYDENHSYLTKTLKEKLAERINETFDEAIKIAKENNTDVMQASKTINKYCHNKFKEYKKANADNLLENIRFEHNLIIKERM